MATEINRAPILVGKAAEEFWQRVENFTTKETPEEIKEGMRQFREFMATQKHFHKCYV